MHMINPIAMMHKQTRIKGYRLPARSLSQATTTARIEAVM